MTSNPNLDTTPLGLETVSGEIVGRDPRDMTNAELNALGHNSNSVLAAVRDKCLDCCAGQPGEVRKCVATDCPLWHIRMGTNPLNRRTLSSEQKAAAQDRAASARQARNT